MPLPRCPCSAHQFRYFSAMLLSLAQVSQFLFGDGFAVAGGDGWRVRRRAVGPSLHRAYLETMIDRVFGPSALHLNDKLQVCAMSSVRHAQNTV